MKLLLYDIVPGLQPYVKAICSIESEGPGCLVPRFRTLPDTCVELFVNYRNNRVADVMGKTCFNNKGSFVTSRMSTYMDVQILPDSGCIAVCFHPGAARHFFTIPMHELADNTTGLEYLWKGHVKEIQEKIADCETNNERVKIVQQYLSKFLAKNFRENNEFEYCLWQINISKGQVPINKLSKKTNISQRQLTRQFNAYMGLPPKGFARVNKFTWSLPALKKFPLQNLTQIAYESGYYDQAHFIHDCREFTGLTPGELLSSTNIIC